MRFQRINEIVTILGPLDGHPVGSMECSGADKWLPAPAGLAALSEGSEAAQCFQSDV